MSALLLIGFGNPLRQDDGAGPAKARALAGCLPGSQLLTVHQLTPEQAGTNASSPAQAVVFVDVSAEVAAEGTADSVQIRPLCAGSASPALGHHLTPASLMVYARLLYQENKPAWLVTVPGHRFGFGSEFSPPVRSALARASTLAGGLQSRLSQKPASV